MHSRTQELITYLDTQRAKLRAAFDAVPHEFHNISPVPDRWSAAGVIEHLATVEKRTAGRLSARVEQARREGAGPELSSEPVLPTFQLERLLDRTTRMAAPQEVQPTGLTAQSAWAELENAGSAVRQALVDADGLNLAAVMLPHPRLGEKSLYYFFAFVGAHEARHAAQLREIADAAAKQSAIAR